MEKKNALENSISQLLSKEQAAVMLGVSTVTLQRYVLKGKIKQIKVGTTVRFERSEIESFKK